MKEKYVLTLKAEDRSGLLHLLTGILNRKLIPITSLNAAPTDIHGIVLVTMEIEISGKALTPLLAKVGNIIEVFAVEAIAIDRVVTARSALFRLDKTVLSSPQAEALAKNGAQIVNIHFDAVIISKSGSDAAIRSLYNALEGPYLQGFSQTGLIADSALILNDESSVISRAA
jgi:acetolactate synthase small subunit